MDPTEPDAELFSQYPFLMGITCLVCMAIYSILSAVMASRFVVEDYSGKRAILLLSYPISRKKVLRAKLMLVFAYTAGAMLLCGAAIQTVFFLTELLFPICSDHLTIKVVLQSLGFLFCCSVLAGLMGVIALWFGFRKKSVSVTIVTSVILAIYIILLVMFSLGQFGCSLFSTYAISVIQARTPEHLMGKVMSYVFTLAMCAQPAGQIIYGALFDWFSDSPYWVLIPSGLLVCVIGLASSKFFVNFEKN